MKILHTKAFWISLGIFIFLWTVPKLLQLFTLTPQFVPDWEQLFEEWYKALLDIGEILLGFVIVNIFWENYKKRQEEISEESTLNKLYESWMKNCCELSRILTSFKSDIRNNDRLSYTKNKQNLYRIFFALMTIGETGLPDKKGISSNSLITIIKKYINGYSRDLQHILDRIESGYLIPGRNITESDEKHFLQIENYLREVEEKFDNPSSSKPR